MGSENIPLYCFRINEETGEITSYELTDYKKILKCSYTNQHEFRFDGRNVGGKIKNITVLREENIGRFVNGKVFLYENDIDKARSIALQEIKDRLTEVEANVKRYKDFYDKLS